MRSWVQLLETASCKNARKGCVHKTQSGQTLPQTLRKRELRAPGCPFLSDGQVDTVLKKCNWSQVVSADIQGFKQYYNDILTVLSNNRNCCFSKLKNSATLMIIQKLFLATGWSSEHMTSRIWYRKEGIKGGYQPNTQNVIGRRPWTFCSKPVDPAKW
jgi:hypothetical protein